MGGTLSGVRNDASEASLNCFLDQIICLTIAPVFFSATTYGLFVVLVKNLDPTVSRMSPRSMAWGFVGCDIVPLDEAFVLLCAMAPYS